MCKHWNETKRGHVQLEYIINNKKNDKIYKKIHFLALSANLNIFCIFLLRCFCMQDYQFDFTVIYGSH